MVTIRCMAPHIGAESSAMGCSSRNAMGPSRTWFACSQCSTILGASTMARTRATARAGPPTLPALRDVLFQLDDEYFKLLDYACKWHAHGRLSAEPTIGTCWDADRLDLGRVGMAPRADYMSTELGRKIAARGSVDGFISENGITGLTSG